MGAMFSSAVVLRGENGLANRVGLRLASLAYGLDLYKIHQSIPESEPVVLAENVPVPSIMFTICH